MASEQMINVNNTADGAIPVTEHKGEPETHAAIAAEGQRAKEGAVSAVLGESGYEQDTVRAGQESQARSREEEENEKTDREFSETIEKLDSVLLEEAGGKEGQIEGEGSDINRAEEVSEQSEGEPNVQVPGDEISAEVPAEETTVPGPGGVTTGLLPAEETIVQVSGGETTVQVPGEATTQVSEGECAAQASEGETAVQVSEEESGAQVSGEGITVQVPEEKSAVQVLEGESAVQVLEGEFFAQVSEAKSTAQVSEGETTVQVSEGEFSVHVSGEEITVQVSVKEVTVKETERETAESVAETTVQASEEASSPVASEVTNNSASQHTWPVTTEEDISPQDVEETGAGMQESAATQVTKAGEAWIDTLVKNIVTEVTSEGTRADYQAHVSTESADSISELTKEEENSCADRTTIPDHVQVTLEETGAAVPVTDVQDQVSYDNTVQEVTGSPGQTGRRQVGISRTGEVTVSLTEQETAAEVEAGSQVKASGQEAHGEVTPDLVTVPSREGTADPGHQACREKEWPPLICTGSEVRADTAEQRGTEQGTVPDKEPCPGAPDMKDREMEGEWVSLTPETPIEKEIRLAMEREMTLRQERGISVSAGEPELVELRRKKVVVEPAALPGKERQLAGAQMQREIQLETQRERDLVEQGKVMGTYDRGHQQELQERKMIFESMKAESSDPPVKRRQSEIQKSDSIEVLVEVPAPSNHVFSSAPAAEVKKGPSYAEANGSNIIIIEHASILRKPTPGNVYSAAPADLRRTSPAESRRSAPADLRFTRSSSGNNAFSESPVAAPGSPFQLLRSPSPRSLLEREIEEVKEREQELRRQRTSIYGRDNGTAENSQTTPNTDIQSGEYQPERPNWGKLEVSWPPNRSMTVNGQPDQAWDSPRTRRQRSTLIQSWESGNPNPADEN
ncbi:uncharacterized protein MISP3 isoform 1-T4 [Mantella aurantiaca]